MSISRKNIFHQVADFNRACGNEPTGPFSQLSTLYAGLFLEEAGEAVEALTRLNGITEPGKDIVNEVDALTELVDGLLDTIYVAAGWLHVMGLDGYTLWSEVQRSNMAKIDPETGKVLRREDGKIQKPEGWTPPQLKAIVARELGYVSRARKDIDALLERKAKSGSKVKDEIHQGSLVERMFSVEQAATLCGISPGRIRGDVAAGKLKHKVFGARTVRIPESSLAAYQA